MQGGGLHACIMARADCPLCLDAQAHVLYNIPQRILCRIKRHREMLESSRLCPARSDNSLPSHFPTAGTHHLTQMRVERSHLSFGNFPGLKEYLYQRTVGRIH